MSIVECQFPIFGVMAEFLEELFPPIVLYPCNSSTNFVTWSVSHDEQCDNFFLSGISFSDLNNAISFFKVTSPGFDGIRNNHKAWIIENSLIPLKEICNILYTGRVLDFQVKKEQ